MDKTALKMLSAINQVPEPVVYNRRKNKGVLLLLVNGNLMGR